MVGIHVKHSLLASMLVTFAVTTTRAKCFPLRKIHFALARRGLPSSRHQNHYASEEIELYLPSVLGLHGFVIIHLVISLNIGVSFLYVCPVSPWQ